MHSSQFEAVRHAVMASGQPYRGANLDGMATDIDYYLGNTALFDRIRVMKTGDRRRLLVVRCRPAGRASAHSRSPRNWSASGPRTFASSTKRPMSCRSPTTP
jgi:hypothetical protein